MSETTNETVQDTVQEVATDSQNEPTETPDVGSVIQESILELHYRHREFQ